MGTPLMNRRQIAEMLARKTLRSGSFSDNFNHYSQVLKDGNLQFSASIDDKIVLYKDEFLSLKGLDNTDYNNLLTNHQYFVSQSYEHDYYHDAGGVIDYFQGSGHLSPPDNISQYMTFTTSSVSIDPAKLNEVLNTDIFELLPEQLTRQTEINKFFQAYFSLRPGSSPPYCIDGDTGSYSIDLGPVDCEGCEAGLTACGNELTYADWRLENDISYDESTNEDEYITRLTTEANEDNILDGGITQTLQWIHEDLTKYLHDILNPPPEGVLDTRPEYQHQSDGYLEIRNLNQSIIVKKGEGPNVGVGKDKMLSVDGDEDGSAIWTRMYDTAGFQNNIEIPYYLIDGFTITMWVKFLDKVNGGTLFNFGNPTREWNPHGFKLETYVLNQDDYADMTGTGAGYGGPNTNNFFADNNYERFIRLVVREQDGNNSLRDSHVGTSWAERINTKGILGEIYEDLPAVGNPSPFNYTRVPINFDEWYFVVASYNPYICEDSHAGFGGTHDGFADDVCTDNQSGWLSTTDYWRGNINPSDSSSTHKSGYGAKCKVEIISKTDLLRARGYKPVVEDE